AIEYWTDKDSGHWEEEPKVSASSIGAVVAGLRQLQKLVRFVLASNGNEAASTRFDSPNLAVLCNSLAEADLDALIRHGKDALATILPSECLHADSRKSRPYDAALLFLIYPLAVVDEAMADRIVAQTETHLRGPLGIKRYLNDSFYCTDYESLM